MLSLAPRLAVTSPVTLWQDPPVVKAPAQAAGWPSADELPRQPARKRRRLTEPAGLLPLADAPCRRAGGSSQHAARPRQPAVQVRRPAAKPHPGSVSRVAKRPPAQPSSKGLPGPSRAQQTASSAPGAKSSSRKPQASGARADVAVRAAQKPHQPVHKSPAVQTPPAAPAPAAAAAAAKAPQRTRAEGGRKRRRK